MSAVGQEKIANLPLTFRRQSHLRVVFATPLNRRVFDCARSLLVGESMTAVWDGIVASSFVQLRQPVKSSVKV